MELSSVGARLSALIVVIGVTAGCGGDPPTPPPFIPSTSVSSPTSTAPEEPVLPDAAKEPTAAGAKAFAEFYWDMATYAQTSGDTTAFRKLGASTCRPCIGGADGVDRVYDDGGVIKGGGYTPRALTADDLTTKSPAFKVTLKVRTVAQFVDFPGRAKDRRSKAATNKISMVVGFVDGTWSAATWEVL